MPNEKPFLHRLTPDKVGRILALFTNEKSKWLKYKWVTGEGFIYWFNELMKGRKVYYVSCPTHNRPVCITAKNAVQVFSILDYELEFGNDEYALQGEYCTLKQVPKDFDLIRLFLHFPQDFNFPNYVIRDIIYYYSL